ncbi:hypothetical protein GcM1_c145o5 [Golovinomyces cichoracearum]|uniref:Secreted protein n=1 Tax=Golovinomyces cichoracearum TaxID=62708 RepID=A0A420IAS5_9PEZI|nr:hypothetical protein GcM1_c145o5 [Golovinomyces cichoracearum]
MLWLLLLQLATRSSGHPNLRTTPLLCTIWLHLSSYLQRRSTARPALPKQCTNYLALCKCYCNKGSAVYKS